MITQILHDMVETQLQISYTDVHVAQRKQRIRHRLHALMHEEGFDLVPAFAVQDGALRVTIRIELTDE